MTTIDIDAIRQRLDAATEGPWLAVNDPTDDGAPASSVGVALTDETFVFEDHDTLRDDAEFIAHARTDIPALLAKVAELTAALEEVASLCACGDDFCPSRVARRALGEKTEVTS